VTELSLTTKEIRSIMKKEGELGREDISRLDWDKGTLGHIRMAGD